MKVRNHNHPYIYKQSERYMNPPKVTEPTPDKVAIKKAIKAGEDVPGARLITNTYVKVT